MIFLIPTIPISSVSINVPLAQNSFRYFTSTKAESAALKCFRRTRARATNTK